jgi:hypothetical protein
MSNVVFHYECIILDACCAINLYASKYMSEMLEAISANFAIASYVYSKEVLEVYNGSEEKGPQTKELIHLSPLVENELLTVASLDSENEKIDFLNFAYEIDDGEAATGSIAKHRNWCIGTDDSSAISFFKRQSPQLQVVTTPELIKAWVEIVGPPQAAVTSLIENIQRRANYKPSSRHPLYEWWQICLGSNR